MLKLQGHRRKVCARSRSRRTAAGSRVGAPLERHVSLWELPTGTRTLSPGEQDEIHAMTFTPDGAVVVLASWGYLRRWNLAAGKVQESWMGCTSDCWHIAFSPGDVSLLAAFSYPSRGHTKRPRVELLHKAKRFKRTTLNADHGWPVDMKFSPSGRLLAAVSNGVRIWNLEEEAKPVSLDVAGNKHAVAFSADETRVVLSAAKKLTVYDLATRKPVGQLTGHTGYVCALAVAPNGTLLSAADDGTARLWDVTTRRELACFEWKIGRLNAAAFSPDGALAAVGGEDGIVVWDVD